MKLIVVAEDVYDKAKADVEKLVAEVHNLYQKLKTHGHSVHANPETAKALAGSVTGHLAALDETKSTVEETDTPPVVPETPAPAPSAPSPAAETPVPPAEAPAASAAPAAA